MSSFLYSLRKNFYNDVYIGIVLHETQCRINVDVVKNSRVQKNEKRTFFTKEHKITEEIMDFVFKYTRAYNFAFVSTHIDASNQGAIKECSKDAMRKFSINDYEVKTSCIDKKWLTFAYKKDVEELKSKFDEMGIDFIFSPFIIIYFLFKEKPTTETMMYILNTKETITFAVVKNNIILFSDHIHLLKLETKEEFEEKSDVVELPTNTDFDSEFSEFEDDLDDHLFNDTEELDHDLDFDDSDIKMDAAPLKNDNKNKESSAASMNNDIEKSIELLGYIKNAIEEFYKNGLYESEFIAKVIVATDEKLNIDVCKYIEEEILIDIELLNIDMALLLSKITHEECRYNV